MPDEAIPQFITVSANGAIGANFTGHIAAQGIDLHENSTIDPNINLIDWLDGSSVAQQQIAGQRVSSSIHRLSLNASAGGTVFELLDANDNPILSKITGSVEGKGYTLMNAGGGSSFLRMAGSILSWGAAVGSNTLTYTASGTTTVVVNHGLGATPSIALAVAQRDDAGGLGILTNCAVGNFSTTQFTIQGTRIDGAAGTGNVTIYWLVIGLI